MKKLLLLLGLVIYIAITIPSLPVHAQAAPVDYFGGRPDVPCSAPTNQISGTAVQNGTTVTFTPSNVTAVSVDILFPSDWDVTMSNGQTVIYGPSEPMEITNSNSPLDYSLNVTGIIQTQGALALTLINTSTFVFTLTSTASQTVGSTAAKLFSAHGYMSPLINKPVYGAGPGYCNQLGNYMFPQVVSQMCVQLDAGLCHYNYTISTISRTSNVVTLTFVSTTPNNIALGSNIKVSGVADSTYNCTIAVPCQVQTKSGNTITYNNTGANGSSSGGSIDTAGWSLKYPAAGGITSPCVAATAIVSKTIDTGFAGPGEDSTGEVTNLLTCPSNPAVPFHLTPGGGTTPFFITYPASNLGGNVSQPLHDLIHTMNRGFLPANFTPAGAIPDVFDSRLVTFDLLHFAGTGFTTNYHSPAGCCITYDDSDNFKATCGSGLFPGINGGVTNGEGSGQCWHVGLIVALSAPHETATIWNKVFNQALIDTHIKGPYLYPDNTNYSKRFTGVKTGCFAAETLTAPSGNLFNPSQTNFCTLADWICTWYGTIGAANAAWGSSYTTCGTSETTTASESYVTGDGINTVFAHTFANHTPAVTPKSVAVYMNGVQVSGDCRGAPNAEAGCTAATGTGNFIVMHAFQASIGVPVGFILIDSDGDYEEATVAGTTAATAPTWHGGTGSAGCTGTQTTISGGVTFLCLGPSISSGNINYATGVATITFAHILPTQDSITVSYTTGGWAAGGTGFVDEDGSFYGGVGTNPVCVLNPTPWTPGMTYVAWRTFIFDSVSNTWQLAKGNGVAGGSRPSFATTPGTITFDNGVPLGSLGFPVCSNTSTIIAHVIDANQNWAVDMTNWLGYGYTAKGASGFHSVVNRLFPGVLDLGPNFSLQGYDIPMYYQALQALAKFTDGGFTGAFPTLDADDPAGTLKAQYIMNFYPNPIFEENFNQVQSGWEVDDNSCAIAFLCQPTNAARMNHFYNLTLNALSFKSPSGLTQMGGSTWFGNVGFQGHGFGYEDKNNNRQKSPENGTASVPCLPPLQTLTCGGDLAAAPWTNTDTETKLTSALLLWRATVSSSGASPGTCPQCLLFNGEGKR